MRVLSSTYGSREDADPLAEPGMRLQELSAETRTYAPPHHARARTCGPSNYLEQPAKAGGPLLLGRPLPAAEAKTLRRKGQT